ncbi:MAG: ATP-dependent helicase, partial [Alphaproteobacteria bacterium]
FHSLGLAILREHGSAAGLHRGFRVAGEVERAAALGEALGFSPRKVASLLRLVSKAKCREAPIGGAAAEALAAYQQVMTLRNWIDFDDLVALAVRLLESDVELARHYRERFRWIAVDEFQDVDEQQYRLLTLLAARDGNLSVIGDPNQAIYGFRGADATCFARFAADYPSTTVVALGRNYRSSGTIVAASAQVIAASPESRPLAAVVREMHERIAIHAAATEAAEAEFAVATIERLIGGHSFFSIDSGRAADAAKANLSFADFAVLYRTDAQSAAFVEAFARSGMPFKKSSHEPLAASPAVQAILAALNAASGDSELSARLAAAAERLRRSGDGPEGAALETAYQRLATLAEAAACQGRPFADAVALAAEADFWDPRADRVSLLTLHAAKGLEFAVVFIAGLEDGLLPLHWNGLDEAAGAEERRLLYVGMTRAKDRLILSRAVKRLWRGRVQSLAPSPFLADIESELVKHQHSDAVRRKPGERQLKLF